MLVVVWRVTERCDFACKFCGSSRALQRARAEAQVAPTLRLGALLGEYHKQTGRPVLVSWLGGEPFLWKPLLTVSETFRNEFSLRVGVTTNGRALVSETLRRRVLTTFDEITFSVDGSRAFHDRVRGANGSYAQIGAALARLATMKRAQNANLRLRVNTILMRENIAAFAGLCEKLSAWGVEELTFNVLGGRERPEFFPTQRVSAEAFEAFAAQLPRVRATMRARGLQIAGSAGYVERLRAATRGLPVALDDCAPGQTFLFVDAQGLVAPCAYTANPYGICLDELQNVADLVALPARFTAQRAAHTHSACADCPATHVVQKFALVPAPPSDF